MTGWTLTVVLGCLLHEVASQETLGDRLITGIFEQEDQPLTVADAEAKNWQRLNDGCDPQQGIRYRFPGRLTPTLMFSDSGHIAGFQTVVDTTVFPLYPASNLRDGPHFTTDDNNEATSSIFFMDPSKICSDQPSDHVEGSIGDRMWLRRGAASSAQIDFEIIPLTEAGIIAGAPANGYAPGGCAATGFAFPGSPGMGRHYWQFLDVDTPAIDSGPLFLLYDRGMLVAFGLTFVGTNYNVPSDNGVRPTLNQFGTYDMPEPSLWEFALQPLYPYFFDEADMPLFLRNLNLFDDSLPDGDVTTGTMHIFVSDPFAMTCAPVDVGSGGGNDGLGDGVIVGIIVGCLCGVGLITAAVFTTKSGQPPAGGGDDDFAYKAST